MKKLTNLILGAITVAAVLAAQPSRAQSANASMTPVARQELAPIRDTIEQFLQTQGAGLPGRVEIKVGAIDSRLNMPACAALEAFLPGGSKVWGKTTVGVRCNAPSPWTIYVASQVSVWSDYLAAAAPLAQNQQVGKADVVKLSGDLTTLPAGILTDPNQAIGRSVAMSIPLGTPLRRDSLRQQAAVQQGQLVRLVTSGPGFKVSTDGRAMNNASEGQIAQARTQNGQLISGVARLGGVVEVAY